MKPKTLTCKTCNRGFWTIYGRDRHARSTHGAAGSKASNGANNGASSNGGGGGDSSSSSSTSTSTKGSAGKRSSATAASATTPRNKNYGKSSEVDLTDDMENDSAKKKKGAFVSLFV